MNALATLYDFETPVETAFDRLLTEAELVVYTPLKDLELQSKRPRVELVCSIGAAEGEHLPELTRIPVGGVCHDLARRFRLQCRCITDSKITLHREYVATLRGNMAHCLDAINGFAPMLKHCIQELNEAGTTPAYKPEEGVFVTDIFYEGRITMQVDEAQALIQ